MTAVKSVTAKKYTGFEKKKILEHNGCEFVKHPIAGSSAQEWVCIFEGEIIARHRLQGECVNLAVEALGGE